MVSVKGLAFQGRTAEYCAVRLRKRHWSAGILLTLRPGDLGAWPAAPKFAVRLHFKRLWALRARSVRLASIQDQRDVRFVAVA
jgi:hypothetical protein